MPPKGQKITAANIAKAAANLAIKYANHEYVGKPAKGPFGSGTLKKGRNRATKFTQDSGTQTSSGAGPSSHRVRGRKYNTIGAALQSTSALKVKKPTNYNIRGSVIKTENGGVSTATTLQSLYLGHGLATVQVARGVFRGIVKNLFSQAGVTFTNWSDTAAFAGKIGVYFVENPAIVTPSIGGFEVTHTTSQTYTEISTAVLNQVITSFVQGYDYEFTRFYLVDTTNTNAMVVAQMMAKQMEFDISMTSRLAVQNRTTAQTGDDQEDDITNNPLVGKTYGSPHHWANYVEPKDRTTGNMANSYTANRETGIITVKSVDTNTSALQKPPPCWFFNFKKESKLVILPGNIANQYLRWSVQGIKINTLLKKMPNAFKFAGEMAEDFGTVGLIGLEKLLDSNRTSGTGTNISVGYEINQQYAIALNYKKFVPSSPILEVGANQITSS